MKKEIIISLLLFIMYTYLLIGCGTNISTEELLPDVSDNISASVSDNAEILISGSIEINETLNDNQSNNIERTIQGAIMDGDFSGMEDTVEFKEYVIESYQCWEENGTLETMEWRQLDLNKDGIDDLILQECQSVGQTQMHRIIAVFACKEDNARCMLWDVNDSTEYSFCGATGELMYTAPYSGTAIAGEPYRHYYYDGEWNKIEDYLLIRTTVDSSMDGSREEFLQYHQRFLEANPDMAEDGEYFSRYEIDIETGGQGEREALSYEEFKEIFEDVMGIEYIKIVN